MDPAIHTFLFTDIAGSTRLWQEYPAAMAEALAIHDDVLTATIGNNRGRVFKHTGDGMAVVFAMPSDALRAAVQAQRALNDAAWPDTGQLHVRMGIHTGSAIDREGDFFGTAVNKVARLMGVGHGDQILVSDVTAGLLDAEPEWRLIDLGPHRLRDLAGSVEVLQVAADGLVKDFPPLRTLDAYASNLPHNLPSYVGREELAAEIVNELLMTPVITLAGIGGMGKTRLAQQVGAHVLPHYADGVWFVDLAAVQDRDDLHGAVARVLTIKEQTTEALLTTLSDALRDKNLVLILDNCEQAVEPIAEMVETLMMVAPRLRILATSRVGLGVQGERVWRLEGLDDEAALALFVQRSADVGGKADGVTDRESIIELCRHIDGLPLAIELAAARTKSMTPAQILDKVGQRFRLLKATDRRSDRHQTLQNMIDWSYDLLSDNEKSVLNRLSVFEGLFDMTSVEKVVADDDIDEFDVVDLLDALVSKSLVNADHTGEVVRFRLMETVRAYAATLLVETGEAGELADRHAAYFASRAQTLAARIGGADLQAAVAELSYEIINLNLAFDHLAEQKRFEEMAQLVTGLSMYWASAAPSEGRSRYEQLALVGDRIEPETRVGMLVSAGALMAEQGYAQRGRTLLEEARSVAEMSDIEVPAYLYYSAAGVAEIDDQPEEVLALAAEGLRLAEDDPFITIAIRLRMLTSLIKLNPESAVEHAKETLALAEGMGLDMFVAAGHFQLGSAHMLTGHPEEAEVALDRAIAAAGDAVPQVTIGARVISAAARRRDDPEAAVELAQSAIELEAEHSVMPAFRSIAADVIASVWADAGRYDDAAVVLAAGEGLRERLEFAGLWWGRAIHDEVLAAVSIGLEAQELEAALDRGKRMAAAEVERLLFGSEPEKVST